MSCAKGLKALLLKGFVDILVSTVKALLLWKTKYDIRKQEPLKRLIPQDLAPGNFFGK